MKFSHPIMTNDLNTLKKQLLQLRELHEAGALPREQYDAARAPLEQRVLELVMSQPAAAPRASRRLWLLIGAGIVLLAGVITLLLVLRRRSRLADDQFEADPDDTGTREPPR